jgi:tRNA(Ile)-lysidine synthetase-like protein
MIKLLTPLPKKLYVACSGGVDSMAALDFLSRKHDVTAAYFDHYTTHGMEAKHWVWRYCQNKNIPFIHSELSRPKLSGESIEEYWRDERYKFLDSLDAPVVTGHHLDDAVETWVWASMHGQPKLPEIQRNNVVRPFLATPKQELINWCIRKNVPWYDDMTNLDTKYMRNYIRHEVMPVVQKINPGIQKTIKKKLLSKLDSVY